MYYCDTLLGRNDRLSTNRDMQLTKNFEISCLDLHALSLRWLLRSTLLCTQFLNWKVAMSDSGFENLNEYSNSWKNSDNALRNLGFILT